MAAAALRRVDTAGLLLGRAAIREREPARDHFDTQCDVEGSRRWPGRRSADENALRVDPPRPLFSRGLVELPLHSVHARAAAYDRRRSVSGCRAGDIAHVPLSDPPKPRT